MLRRFALVGVIQNAFAASRRCSRSIRALCLILSLSVYCGGAAPTKSGVLELGHHVFVFPTATGNVVASIGKDGALLVGTPSAASTTRINRMIAKQTRSSFRYVLIAPQDTVHSEGDAGWGHLGAFVAMHENALRRLGGATMGAPSPLPVRLVQLGVDRPKIAFSQVLAFDLNGDSIHVVHQMPGYSDGDAIVHFHEANLVYLGEVFPGDGYPTIDREQGGTLEGELKTLEMWTDPTYRVIPARGNPTDGASVREFRDMIISARDRIQHLIASGKNENQVIAEHPTVDLDARWGQGRVRPDDFVRTLYECLKDTQEK